MPSTSSDDDAPMARVVGEEAPPTREYDPRPEFLQGFQEGRPVEKAQPPTTMETELAALLNKYSREGLSNTPDYILARFLLGCLSAFEIAVNVRDQNAR